MHSTIRIASFVLLLTGVKAEAQIEVIDDPIRYFASGYFDTTENGKTIDNVMVRIVLDFNNDGLADIALSDSYLWGNAGGEWEIYLRRNDHKYQHLGTIFFHPDAFRVEPVRKGVSQFVAYVHASAADGDLNRFEISSDSIAFISSYRLVTSDENPPGQKEYERLFGYLRSKPVCENIAMFGYLKDPTLPWHPGY